jgi:lipoprotein NlpD
VSWQWPASGGVIARFLAGDSTHQGIEIAGREGSGVHAAADGEVVYSGNGLVGYGELIIIKHSNEFLSAYARNSRRLVKEGDKVKAGQAIAEIGRGGSTVDAVHFEIRRAGKPDDPLKYLPTRN